MLNDSKKTIIDRFYILLHAQLRQQLPQPNGIHIYSKGALIQGFKSVKSKNGWQMIISENIDYGAKALGYGKNGEKLKPRPSKTGLEVRNFKILGNAIRKISRLVGSATDIEVRLNGFKL